MYRASSLGMSDSTSLREMESTIRAMSQDFCIAFNTGNYDQAAALFTADAVFMPPHEESFQGATAIERTLREFGSSGYKSLRLKTMRVDGSGDMALEIGLRGYRSQGNCDPGGSWQVSPRMAALWCMAHYRRLLE